MSQAGASQVSRAEALPERGFLQVPQCAVVEH